MTEPDLYDFSYIGNGEYTITFDGDGLLTMRGVSEHDLSKITGALNGARRMGIMEGERRTLETWTNVDIERSSRL